MILSTKTACTSKVQGIEFRALALHLVRITTIGQMQGTTAEMEKKRRRSPVCTPLYLLYLRYPYLCTSCTPMYLLCLCVPLVPLVPLCTSCMVNLLHHLYGKPPTFTGAGEPLAEEQVQLLHLQHFSSFSPPASCLPPSS